MRTIKEKLLPCAANVQDVEKVTTSQSALTYYPVKINELSRLLKSTKKETLSIHLKENLFLFIYLFIFNLHCTSSIYGNHSKLKYN